MKKFSEYYQNGKEFTTRQGEKVAPHVAKAWDHTKGFTSKVLYTTAVVVASVGLLSLAGLAGEKSKR